MDTCPEESNTCNRKDNWAGVRNRNYAFLPPHKSVGWGGRVYRFAVQESGQAFFFVIESSVRMDWKSLCSACMVSPWPWGNAIWPPGIWRILRCLLQHILYLSSKYPVGFDKVGNFLDCITGGGWTSQFARIHIQVSSLACFTRL